ncbi:hypothetical protein CERZMDRAFT_89684 [Cercospora zeae-maydis SCOH1-5]|uniref:Uncharacterized protein n=1 Tax=Cercospora zeae-maydis SCOH1-5 TaxID=717836 RepID=A0A6A6FT58_9PEZI|nr:hypothetical protein CERZMDRAFT_89684 [Cercospora zeae-maydis SCOH1-5]
MLQVRAKQASGMWGIMLPLLFFEGRKITKQIRNDIFLQKKSCSKLSRSPSKLRSPILSLFFSIQNDVGIREESGPIASSSAVS